MVEQVPPTLMLGPPPSEILVHGCYLQGLDICANWNYHQFSVPEITCAEKLLISGVFGLI